MCISPLHYNYEIFIYADTHCTVFHCITIIQFSHPVSWTFRLFPCGSIHLNTCLLVHIYKTVRLGVGFLDTTTYSFTSNSQIALQSTCINLQSHQQWMRLHDITDLCQHLALSNINFCWAGGCVWYNITVLIGISLINSESKHLSVFLLTFWGSSSANR